MGTDALGTMVMFAGKEARRRGGRARSRGDDGGVGSSVVCQGRPLEVWGYTCG